MAAEDAMQPDGAADGHARAYCGATLKQDRDDGRVNCTNARGFRTSHPGYGNCFLHAGATPAGVAAAERERTETLLADARQVFGLPLDVEPADALLGLVRTSAGIVAWLSRQVAQLEVGKVTTVNQKPHPLVEIYLDERKHLESVARTAIAAGLAERRVQLEEEQGRLLVGMLERLLRRCDELVQQRTGKRVLDPMDPEVRDIVRAELMTITGDAA